MRLLGRFEHICRSHQMHEARVDAGDALMDGLQARQQLLDAKGAQGVDARRIALKKSQVQGHGWRQMAPIGRAGRHHRTGPAKR